MESTRPKGFDEVVRKLLKQLPPEQVLAAYTPEQVLATYTPEQALAAYTPEQVLLALPVEVLKGFSDAYLDSLSEPTRSAIRARIAKPRAKSSQGKARKPARSRRTATKSRG